MKISQLINFYIAVLMVCSPFSAIPVFLGLTQGKSLQERRKIALVAFFSVGIILVLVTWIGTPLLSFFGIRIGAFQLAGGIIVFLLALSMLNAEVSRMVQTSEDQEEAKKKESIAVVPLAMPLMAGPGAISSVIVATELFPSTEHRMYLSLCFLLVAVTLGLCLYFSSFLERWLGATGLNIVNRIGGLILAAIAMETIAKGVVALFPGLC